MILYLTTILITFSYFSLLQKQPYLKKLQWGPPANLYLLEQLFSHVVVDGGSAFVPGDDFGHEVEEDEGEAEAQEQEPIVTPRSTSNQRSKRSASSTSSTLNGPLKKSKIPIVRYVKDIANTFKEVVNVNTKQLKKRVEQKEAFSVKKCRDLGGSVELRQLHKLYMQCPSFFV
jgi:hypothetical protein